MPHSTPRITSLKGNSLQIAAPAKLNLGLRVFPPRPDGFHDIESWFVPLAWHDTITIAPADALSLTLSGRTQNIPTELEKNLITRAALLLAKHANITPRAHIHLHKILPPGGGLGGGSSDAASTLLALAHLWNLPYSPEQLLPLAAQLGSDIPFFIHAQPSLCTGRGEIITPLPLHHPLFAVLLIPPQGCPTKEVFQTFDAMLATPQNSTRSVSEGRPNQSQNKAPIDKINWPHLATLPAESLNRLLENDLAPPAYKIAPWLESLKTHAQSLIHQPLHLTGSGSTLFTLTSNSTHANEITTQLTTSLDNSITILPTQILRHAGP